GALVPDEGDGIVLLAGVIEVRLLGVSLELRKFLGWRRGGEQRLDVLHRDLETIDRGVNPGAKRLVDQPRKGSQASASGRLRVQLGEPLLPGRLDLFLKLLVGPRSAYGDRFSLAKLALEFDGKLWVDLPHRVEDLRRDGPQVGCKVLEPF